MALRDTLRILVVDDMSTSRGLITQALDTIGIRNVTTAACGPTAVEIASRSQVHLVISDLNMPGMDGLGLLHALRSGEKTARVGFILITGRLDPATMDKGRRLGMNNVVTKPFDSTSLQRAIEAVVGRL
jgi:two-component system chemotaxis response regulator CheY